MRFKTDHAGWLFLSLCISSIVGHTSLTYSQDSTLVNTSKGAVQGFVRDNARLFLGIPFGESTAGQNRFSAPVPKASWYPQVVNALSFKPACPQICMLPSYMCPVNHSEDCLALNVYAPIPTSINPGPWPVMAFIYGGAFTQGTSMIQIYSGEYLAANDDVVVVTGEYRTGVLGFLVTDQVQGNFGIQDQQLMLQWIQTEISSFGGNPSLVTLFGESAGAMSTAIHWISPLSSNLFNKLIFESDPFSIEMPTPSEAKIASRGFCKIIGCDFDDIKCLQNADVQKVVNAGNKAISVPDIFNYTLEFALAWQPNIDGALVPNQILRSIDSGKYSRVPVLLGTNTDEGIMFAYQATNYVDNLEYSALLAAVFKKDSLEVYDEYPVTYDPLTNVIDNVSALITDYVFACSGRALADRIADDVPFFLYHYDHVLSFYQSWGPNFTYCWDKCCHGSELPFVFHSVTGVFNYTDAELNLADQMTTYWTNFAKTGNPNNGLSVDVEWPQYSNATRMNIKLSIPIVQEQRYKEEKCSFWDELGYFF